MKTFGTKLVRLVRAAIEDGEPIWPERFSLETLALKRLQQGEYKFSCLMMNNPRNVDLQDLNIQDANFWEWSSDEREVVLYRDGVELRRWRLDQLDVTTCVDLAPAEKAQSDRNAVVTVGVSPLNEAIVLDAWGQRCTPLALIEKLLEVKLRYSPRAFGIEDVAYQKALKYFVKQEAERRGIYLNIVPIKAIGKKEIRIRGLQPIMATGRMYIRANQHLLRNEMSDFPLGEHDDVLDALSMHLQLFRGQMSPERWEKYKASEKDLLRRLRTGDTSMRPLQLVQDFDRDDEPDEFDAPRVAITERIIA
jgi:predicted phage terminase large subunit-like protein